MRRLRCDKLVVAIAAFLIFGLAGAGSGRAGHLEGRQPHGRQASEPRHYYDDGHHDDRAYPVRGAVVRVVPRDVRVVVHSGTRYYFSAGVWYLPRGGRYVVVAPPVGLFVPVLPPYYTAVWVGGVPYYYANEVYYTPHAGGYVVVEPPKGEMGEAPGADKVFVYPRQGQSERQQADDRWACHQWAVNQTGFDPTGPPQEAPAAKRLEKRADYNRAFAACLDGRGYTVK